MKECWIRFSTSGENRMVLVFILLIWTEWHFIDLCFEPFLRLCDQSQLLMVDDCFHKLLDLICSHFVEYFCIYVCQGYWPVIFLIYSVCFWYEGNTDATKSLEEFFLLIFGRVWEGMVLVFLLMFGTIHLWSYQVLDNFFIDDGGFKKKKKYIYLLSRKAEWQREIKIFGHLVHSPSGFCGRIRPGLKSGVQKLIWVFQINALA